jgi:N-acyl-L-homoserine lactone synthetase
MLQFSTGTKQQLPPGLFEEMGQYRREVFINRLGWELNTVNDLKLDEFDGPDAVYVCSHDDEGNVDGVARLLPTTGPYLMEKAFPSLWAGKDLPCDPTIWELSRFAMVDISGCTELPAHQSSANGAPYLLRQVYRTAKLLGARTLITVSPVGMEKLLRRNGYQAKRAGMPQVCQGSPIVALQIPLVSVDVYVIPNEGLPKFVIASSALTRRSISA